MKSVDLGLKLDQDKISFVGSALVPISKHGGIFVDVETNLKRWEAAAGVRLRW
tara:strand:- start:275 stop:433 length:159 start_codon:yes stop_codon:yes gene_type:complete